MTTRANFEFYDAFSVSDGTLRWQKTALLYHPESKYPAQMGPELENRLDQVNWSLERVGHPDWWDGGHVSALLVKLSSPWYLFRLGVPGFQPCLELGGDIEYLWRVFLGPDEGVYQIECLHVWHDACRDVIDGLATVDWYDEMVKSRT